ncbi:MAG: hypothetical protein R3344_06830 [Acidobacteriota bacterium]|nr:hypothetical protein [Acidobacteriota bacterium]
MRRILGIISAAMLAAMVLASPAGAASSPDAAAWLEKVAAIHEQGPFSVDYTATLRSTQMGAQTTMEMNGKVTYGSEKHIRMVFDMKMEMPGGAGTMEMDVVSVADGETVWMSIDNPMLGGKQIMKIPIDKMEELAKSQGSAAFGGGTSMDPMSQIGTLAEKFDFDVVDDSGGKVTLEAELTAEGLKDLPQAQGVENLGSLYIVIDKKTNIPAEMRMGDDDPYVVMIFSNPTFHEEGSLPEDIFVFVVPEGARVIDLGQMLSGTPGY